ncbi:MAG: ACT domain-containing protein [Anaerolineales bacterium]
MDLPPGLVYIVAQTRLFTDARDYVILRTAPDQAGAAETLFSQLDESFSALVRDKDEVTLVLPVDVWEKSQPLLDVLDESSNYRLITFDLPLELGLVGYLAMMTSTVADEGISIFSVSAFSRDHIFVPEEDFERAWDALRALIRSCQAQEEKLEV